MEREERNYRIVAPFAGRNIPRQYGSFRLDRWHVLLMEDLGPATIPPWTREKARLASRSYARFHRRTLGATLPRALPRTQHQRFGRHWGELAKTGALESTASLAGRRRDEAREWLDVALPTLRDLERSLVSARRPFVLLHFDTRSDNIRLIGERLVMFDWPFASVGPAEFDTAAFAQAVTAEGGPLPEDIIAWYEEVLPLRRRELDGAVAGIAGFFAFASPRPPLPGLPRLRSIQRRQFKATLAWAARRSALPEPLWLGAVAD